MSDPTRMMTVADGSRSLLYPGSGAIVTLGSKGKESIQYALPGAIPDRFFAPPTHPLFA